MSIGPHTEYHSQTQGVLQGSCSGPALWNLVLTPLLISDWDPHTSLQAFADDVILHVKGSTRRQLEERTGLALERIQTWTASQKLQINADKTKALLFNKPHKLRRLPTIKLNQRNVKFVTNLKYLGVVLDPSLNWTAHTQLLKRKTSSLLHVLSRLSGPDWGMNKKLRKCFYNSTIVPTIAYAAGVWGSEINGRKLRQINQIQKGFLLRITGAYSTTPLAALCVATGIPPLHLQIKLIAKQSHYFLFHEDINVQNITFNSKDLETRPVKWYQHPSTQLARISSGSFDPNTANHDRNMIYTDGSKSDGGVAAAFCHYTEGNLISTQAWKLSNFNTVFQAEALAILNAVKTASKLQAPCTICSDSKSAIMSLNNPFPRSHLIREIKCLLQQERDFKIQWIKAHAGYTRNDAADKAAKAATTSTNLPEISLPIPHSHIKGLLKEELISLWQEEWQEGDTGRTYYEVVPKANLLQNVVHRDIIILLTEHGPTPQYLNKIKVLNSPNCLECGIPGTMLHYVTSCAETRKWHIEWRSSTPLVNWYRGIIKSPNLRRRLREVIEWLANKFR